MNLTRKEFIKNLVATAVSASAANSIAGLIPQEDRYEFVYIDSYYGYRLDIGTFALSEPKTVWSDQMSREDVVRRIAMELIKGGQKESEYADRSMIHSHNVLVYKNGELVKNFNIGSNGLVYMFIGRQRDGEFEFRFRKEVFDMKNRLEKEIA